MSRLLSVQQINKYIKNMFLGDLLLGDVQVQGEVSNCKYHQSGHVYFTLKDEKAAINCAMFAGNRAGLTFSMRDGDKVVVSGYIDVYEKTGSYQLYARRIKKEGAGELYERFLALKEELGEMGMFAPEYKRAIPEYPKKIGVVTAPTGAAIRDIQNVLRRRNPGVQIILFPALVQGEGAKESIVKGLQVLDGFGVDVIICGRGGGSIEDLWAFNEEVVARAIFNCETPVISAVGHETDTTIADFVADLRAPTPTAAAELASTDIVSVVEKLSFYEKRLVSGIDRKLENSKNQLLIFKKRLDAGKPDNILAVQRERIKAAEKLLQVSMDQAVKEHKENLIKIKDILERQKEQVLSEKKHMLCLLAERLDMSSPLKKLTAGFAFTEDEKGNPVASVENVKAGDVIRVNLKDGYIRSEVKETVNTSLKGVR